MKNRCTLASVLISCYLFSFANAQSSINPSGGNASGTGGTVSYTVGQIDYTFQNGSNGSLNQGVQQPYKKASMSIDNTQGFLGSIYPNPSSSIIKLELHEFKGYSLQLTDYIGKVLKEFDLIAPLSEVNLQQYSSGNYIINILYKEKLIQSFKIVKK